LPSIRSARNKTVLAITKCSQDPVRSVRFECNFCSVIVTEETVWGC
jgi:hypothetical protein